jgi:hypothetical protein
MTSLLRATSYLIPYSTYARNIVSKVPLTVLSLLLRQQHLNCNIIAVHIFLSVSMDCSITNVTDVQNGYGVMHIVSVTHTFIYFIHKVSHFQICHQHVGRGGQHIETVEPLAFKICHFCHPNTITAVIPSLSQSASTPSQLSS